ncbi:hypothetical protein G3545_11455 [Starkeya sp. ORNL1]|uniref:hypothetical protein n=1 Tax=Starkeya sp. ORNL1 TaxID=2709380 RepID=UPI00146427AE|nr:hypothetical protein [Starkeya sp. ORNL1]QJP14214.1 hypothetical protein G3545_11455 [Starkeya sp. ORNL1]
MNTRIRKARVPSADRRIAAPEGWDPVLRAEFETNQLNGCVGHVLVSETERVRVWSLRLRPGERIGFHRHVLDYFWTALSTGRAVSHFGDGRIGESVYEPGLTRHMAFGPGDFMVHDLANVGDTELTFTTVEFLDSANPPLPVPEHVRRERQSFERNEPIRL